MSHRRFVAAVRPSRRSLSGSRKPSLQFDSLETRSLLSNVLVNSAYTTNDQSLPSVSVNPTTGASVVVWQSYDQTNGGSMYDIYGQLYNADGTANGPEFLINTTTTNNQQRPSVSMNSSGNFVVVWDSQGQYNDLDVIGRFFGPDATPLTSEFLVNTTTLNNQYEPYVALNASNQFAVTWMSDGQGPTQLGSGGGGGGGGGGQAIRPSSPAVPRPSGSTAPTQHPIALLAPGGGGGTGGGGGGGGGVIPNLQGIMVAEFQESGGVITEDSAGEQVVNTYQSSPEGVITAPSVGIDEAGDFAVTFTGEDSTAYHNGVHYDYTYAYVRRYSNGETPIDAGQVMVNSNYTDNVGTSSIAVNASGEIVVAWNGGPYDPGTFAQIYVNTWNFNPTSTPTADAAVSAITSGDIILLDPRVAINSSGTYAVVWEQAYNSQAPSTINSPAGMINDVNGVNNTAPAIAIDDNGNIIYVWDEPDSGGYQDVYGQWS